MRKRTIKFFLIVLSLIFTIVPVDNVRADTMNKTVTIMYDTSTNIPNAYEYNDGIYSGTLTQVGSPVQVPVSGDTVDMTMVISHPYMLGYEKSFSIWKIYNYNYNPYRPEDSSNLKYFVGLTLPNINDIYDRDSYTEMALVSSTGDAILSDPFMLNSQVLKPPTKNGEIPDGNYYGANVDTTWHSSNWPKVKSYATNQITPSQTIYRYVNGKTYLYKLNPSSTTSSTIYNGFYSPAPGNNYTLPGASSASVMSESFPKSLPPANQRVVGNEGVEQSQFVYQRIQYKVVYSGNVSTPDTKKPIVTVKVTPNPVEEDQSIIYSSTMAGDQGIASYTYTLTNLDTGDVYKYNNTLPPTVFQTAGLSPGNYNISLQALGNNLKLSNGIIIPGKWSDTASQNFVVTPSLAINSLTMTSIVNPPLGTIAPVKYPVQIPTKIKAGYNMNFNLKVKGGNILNIRVFANGQPIMVNTSSGKTSNIIINKSESQSDITFMYFLDKDVPKGAVLDMKFILSKQYADGTTKSVVDNDLGWRFAQIVGSSEEDSSINLTN